MRKALFALAVASSLAAPSSVVGSLQALLGSIWHTAPATKEGCGMDPSGRCVPTPALQVQGDAGCGADPERALQSGFIG
jgi:hypothetical protein